MITYIHYGDSKFNKDKLLESIRIKDISPNGKPEGLWASRIDSGYSWKNWCTDECFHMERLEESFCFTLSKDAKILHVYEEDDIIPYVIITGPFRIYRTYFTMTGVGDEYDMEKLKSDGYDGIELHLSESDFPLRDTIFYSWDCDSIVIWNPDVIIPCDK